MTLEAQFALIVEEHRQSLAAPLSARKVLLVAVLLDHFADLVFTRWRDMPERVLGAQDVLDWRATLAKQCPALALVAHLASGKHDGATLRIDTIRLPIADYPALGIEDYMVSLYNQNSVQRVVVARRDGSTVLAHDILAAALAYLDKAGWR